MLNRNIKSGFTLVELLIVAPLIILIIGGFIAVAIAMTGDILTTRGANSLAYNIQDALSRIELDTKLSGSYLATNNITLTSPQGYNNDTTAFHNATTNTSIGPMFILNSYTTTANPILSTRNLVYTNSPSACNSGSSNTNFPLVANIIYFVKDSTLWRRTVSRSDYATVGCDFSNSSSVVPWQQPSCYPGVSNAFCKTQDIKLVTGVSSNGGFTVNYYSSLNPETELTTASDGSQSDSARLTSMQLAKAAKITITATATVSGRDISQTGSIVVASPNNNTSSQ